MKISPFDLNNIRNQINNNQINIIISYGDPLVIQYLFSQIKKLFIINKEIFISDLSETIFEQDFFGRSCFFLKADVLKKIDFTKLSESNNFFFIISEENFSNLMKQNKYENIAFVNCYPLESQVINLIKTKIPNNILVTDKIIKIIINKCGLSNINSIALEVDKLIYYCQNNNKNKIDIVDVLKITSNFSNNLNDDLFFALINQDCFEYFNILKNINLDFMLIIRIFLKYINNMILLKNIQAKDIKIFNINVEIAKLKIFYKYIERFKSSVLNLDIDFLNKVLELIYNLEYSYKSNSILAKNIDTLLTKLYFDIEQL